MVAGLRVTTVRPEIPALLGLSKTAHLIFLGASGQGKMPTAVGVAAHARCPVLMVCETRPRARSRWAWTVVRSVPAQATAFEEARWCGVPLVAVYGWTDAKYATTVPLVYGPYETEPQGGGIAAGAGRVQGVMYQTPRLSEPASILPVAR